MIRPRVLFLSNFPVPYQMELLRAVEAAGELEMIPRFLADRDPGRAWPCDAKELVLPSVGARLPPELRWHPTLLFELARARPDLAIVCGYSYATFQTALLALAVGRVPTLLWAETPRLSQGDVVRRVARRALLAQARFTRGVLAVGTRAAETWRRALSNRVPVASFPYVCDVDRYLALPRAAARDTFTYLFSGQLIHRKGVDVLVEAFTRAAEANPALRLVLAGDGPERARFEALVPEALRPRVEWLGFVSWDALPQVYARADALVIPSRHDGWALVVNEAFAAGLPVIASDAVGAAHDLVVDGVTGRRVPAGEIAPLAAALAELPPHAARMGAAAREVARARLLPSQAAVRLAQLVRATLAGEKLA